MATIDTNMSLVMIDPNEPLELYDGTIIKGRLEWFLYALCCLDYGNLPTPLSRIEEWANALITNELPNMEPQSRAEEFFKAILTGDTSNLPTPQSRSEVLLDKLARGENDFANVEKIQSRYEFLLAYLIKNGGGIGNIDYVLYKFQKEDEILYNTKERPVKSAILKGNTIKKIGLEIGTYNANLEKIEGTNRLRTIESLSGYTSVNIKCKNGYQAYVRAIGVDFGWNSSINAALNSTSVNFIVIFKKDDDSTVSDNDFNNIIDNTNITELSDNNLNELVSVRMPVLTTANQPISPPIMDGLVCWLDGRDGSGTDAIWKDRSGNGNDFALNGFTFDDENGWTGSSLQVNFGQYAICEITLPQEYTIEVDMYADGILNSDQTTFFYFGDGNNSGNWRELAFRKTTATGSSLHTIFSNYTFTVSGDANSFLGTKINLVFVGRKGDICQYRDGVESYKKGLTNLVTNITANFYIGCAGELNRFSKARFNSVKIYNRALTEEEIQHNYLYEQSIERSDTPLLNDEPFKSNILSTSEDVVLRGIGDIRDTLDGNTGELVQSVDEIVLDGSEDWQLAEDRANTMRFNCFGLSMPYGINGSLLVTDKIPYQTPMIDQEGALMGGGESTPKVPTISISKAKLATQDVDGFKQWLSQNPITVQYKLKNHIVKTVDLTITDQGGATIPKLKTFDKITHVNVSATDILPGVEMEVATTIGEDLSGTLYSTMEDIEMKQEALKESNNAQTESVNSTMMAATEIYESLL